MRVWIRALDGSGDRIVSDDRTISSGSWADDSAHLLVLRDRAGDENYHLWLLDIVSGEMRDLTPFEGVRVHRVFTNPRHPDEVLVGLNLRDARVYDVYRIDIASGVMKRDTDNPGDVTDWIPDADFVIRAALATNQADGSTVIRIRDSADTPWRDLLGLPYGEQGHLWGFTADGKAAYVTTTIGFDVTRLVELDLATGRELGMLAQDPRCDVADVLIHPTDRHVQAVAFDYARREWRFLDPAVGADFAAIRDTLSGDLDIVSRDRADENWIVGCSYSDGPTRYYSWARKTRRLVFLWEDRPGLGKVKLAPMEPVVIEARDGLGLPCYLTLPVGVPPSDLPMVLLVHGGPWSRDAWGFNPFVQWLANRGYAVLQVNFRGSTGFGKTFQNKGDRQWGARMQDDLTDAVKWAIGRRYADKDRVAIMGGSYGGYATLVGLAFTSELYACGVDVNGPSNLGTFVESFPPYWAPLRKRVELGVGPVRTDSVFNRRISPLFHVDKIHAPVLIVQGQNDPRVNIRESEQMVAALRAGNLAVEYVVYTDEGHGLNRSENRLDFAGRVERFLARHLGGRSQAWTAVPGSSAQAR